MSDDWDSWGAVLPPKASGDVVVHGAGWDEPLPGQMVNTLPSSTASVVQPFQNQTRNTNQTQETSLPTQSQPSSLQASYQSMPNPATNTSPMSSSANQQQMQQPSAAASSVQSNGGWNVNPTRSAPSLPTQNNGPGMMVQPSSNAQSVGPQGHVPSSTFRQHPESNVAAPTSPMGASNENNAFGPPTTVTSNNSIPSGGGWKTGPTPLSPRAQNGFISASTDGLTPPSSSKVQQDGTTSGATSSGAPGGWNAPSSNGTATGGQIPNPSTTLSNGHSEDFNPSRMNGTGDFKNGNTDGNYNNGNFSTYGNSGAKVPDTSYGGYPERENGNGGTDSFFTQDKRAPPVFAFSVPSDIRGYVIGKQGTNLQRISDETGIRVTRGRPKNDGLDPTDRDFLFFNDNNAPMEKVEEALRQLLIIGRRKLHDWLPEEGKAAEVAKKLADEGKLVDSGPPPPSSGGNGVYGGSGSYSSNGGTAAGYGAANFSGQQQGFANGNYEFQKQMSQRQEGDYQANGNHSSPVQNGFPAQAGPFRDPSSPITPTWSGVPAPTFNSGPRSTVSRVSSTPRDSDKPAYNDGSTVGRPTQGMTGGWNTSTVQTTPSTSTLMNGTSSTAPTSNNGWTPAVTSSNAPAAPIGNSAPPNGNGWTAAPSGTAPSTQPDQDVPAPSVSPTHSFKGSAGSRWAAGPNGNTNEAAASSSMRSPTIPQQPGVTNNVNGTPATGGWQVPAVNSSGSTGIAAPQPEARDRKPTADSGWAEAKSPSAMQTHGPVASSALQSPQPTTQGGWNVGPSKDVHAPIENLTKSIASMNVNGGNSGQGWNAAPAPVSTVPVIPHVGTVGSTTGATGQGWNQPAAPLSAAGSTATQRQSTYQQPQSAPSDAMKERTKQPTATGGIGWGDPAPQATNGSGKDVPLRWSNTAPSATSGPVPVTAANVNANNDANNSGWGAPVASVPESNSGNAYRSDFKAPQDSSIRPSDSASNANGYHQSNNSGGGGYSNENSYGNSNGNMGGGGGSTNNWGPPRNDGYNSYNNGGGSYGGYSGGPPQERRFPGPGGSWASGANEIPLTRNRWISRDGGRPGQDVYRPAVPEARVGSGW